MASAMTEVAVRAAEPDQLAEQSVASVGQTIMMMLRSSTGFFSLCAHTRSHTFALVTL